MFVNHDISLEIESAEELLGRKLNDNEYDDLKNRFNEKVIELATIKFNLQ